MIFPSFICLLLHKHSSLPQHNSISWFIAACRSVCMYVCVCVCVFASVCAWICVEHPRNIHITTWNLLYLQLKNPFLVLSSSPPERMLCMCHLESNFLVWFNVPVLVYSLYELYLLCFTYLYLSLSLLCVTSIQLIKEERSRLCFEKMFHNGVPIFMLYIRIFIKTYKNGDGIQKIKSSCIIISISINS
jgi:hypothetical protein